jgi:hypothetical protein
MYICISHAIAISSLAVFFASQSANPQKQIAERTQTPYLGFA